MGGGGAMRTAVKAAGLGLQNASVRGGLPENVATARKVVRPSASTVSSTASVDETSRLEFAAVTQTAPALAWELDDWEFDGFGLEEQPRLVFGPAPSLEEAKEATSELKDVLDKMYLSPSNSAGSFGSASIIDDKSMVSKSGTALTDAEKCVIDQTSLGPSVPNQALQAFKLLKENSAAQNVVASIAADPNVWTAVLQNDALKEYLHSEKYGTTIEDQNLLKSSEDDVTIEDQNLLKSSEDDVFHDAGSSENIFINAFENVKLAVAGWVNDLSGYFQELFGGPDAKTTSGQASSSTNSTLVGGSLFGLAVMVILVVILKRG